jgi:hypothetical protein
LNDNSTNPATNSSSASVWPVVSANDPGARHQIIARTHAVRARGCSRLRLSSTMPAVSAPAASAASSMLYQKSAWPCPRSCAKPGICAWQALPMNSAAAPASRVMTMITR